MMEFPMIYMASVDPEAVERTRRLADAIGLINRSYPDREIRRQIQRRYNVSYATAWRTVQMARDLA